MPASIGEFPPVTGYRRDVDHWIIQAYEAGAKDFWHLVSLLPGVFPTEVREALARLVAASKVPEHLAIEVEQRKRARGSDSQVPGSPMENPLASDWRFTKETAEYLLERVIASTEPMQTIALLGSPSVYRLEARHDVPRNFILVDQNEAFAACRSHTVSSDSFRCLDLLRDLIELPNVSAVLADPPWYENETLAFLKAAALICADEGPVLLGGTPDGTRPGVADERQRIISGAEKLGLRFLGTERLALSYATPFFEYNALRAAGFAHVAPDWRRGDLLIFRRSGNPLPGPTPSVSSGPKWERVDVLGATVWVRPTEKPSFVAPTLVPLVPGNVLPNVSRRDERRGEADVWTSGNRIFRCDGAHILLPILQAMAASKPPVEMVERSLGHALTRLEIEEVTKCTDQVEDLITAEVQDL